jgi:hypothetical protein
MTSKEQAEANVRMCAETLAVLAQLENMVRYLGTHEQSIRMLEMIRTDIGIMYSTNVKILEDLSK